MLVRLLRMASSRKKSTCISDITYLNEAPPIISLSSVVTPGVRDCIRTAKALRRSQRISWTVRGVHARLQQNQER